MIRHKRHIEDEEDEQLVRTGWEMIGLSLWRHPKFGESNFNKDVALESDVSDFHVIKIEHYKMTNLLKRLVNEKHLEDCICQTNKFLVEMKYI